MSPRLIVALDYPSSEQATVLVNKLDPTLCALKVGSELFTAAGHDFVKYLIDKGYKVFLDLKFHDIPNTVAQACLAAANLGVWMLTLHASGGLNMMKAAVSALASHPNRPLLMGVTILTSMDEQQLQALSINRPLKQQVLYLADLAKQAGLDGVVSSAEEVPYIKETYGELFLALSPGLRLPGQAADDQARITTPAQAVKLGSDFLVLGRAITRAEEPEKVLTELSLSLESLN